MYKSIKTLSEFLFKGSSDLKIFLTIVTAILSFALWGAIAVGHGLYKVDIKPKNELGKYVGYIHSIKRLNRPKRTYFKIEKSGNNVGMSLHTTDEEHNKIVKFSKTELFSVLYQHRAYGHERVIELSVGNMDIKTYERAFDSARNYKIMYEYFLGVGVLWLLSALCFLVVRCRDITKGST